MDGRGPRSCRLHLMLFVYGMSPCSVAAIENARALVEGPLRGWTSLVIIDVRRQPELVVEHGLPALPSLVKQSPPPVQQFVGDLSNQHAVRSALGLAEPPRGVI